MNTRRKRFSWKLLLGLLGTFLVAAALYSIFFSAPPKQAVDPIPKSSPTVQSSPAPVDPFANNAPVDSAPTSQSVDDNADPAYSYNQALTKADEQCKQSGLQPGTTSYDACTEQAISEFGH